jgi:hypothetical protein
MNITSPLVRAVAVCFLLTSCARAAQPLAVHMQATRYQDEHDEVVSRDSVADYYPSRQSPHEVVYHKLSGGMLDATCMDAGCKQLSIKISGSKTVPDGTYQFLQTDDPHIIMVRDSEGARPLGYLARNNGGGVLKFFPELQDAQDYEHKGDAARTAGKVVGGALLVAALAALFVVAAAAAANANRVTTTCSTFGNTTTCTSR